MMDEDLQISLHGSTGMRFNWAINNAHMHEVCTKDTMNDSVDGTSVLQHQLS